VSGYFAQQHPYPPVPAFVWPEPGQRTWQPPGESFFGACRPGPECCGGIACPVGVRTVGSGVYGCDGACHDGQRARLTADR
jgi:hypothetical protein